MKSHYFTQLLPMPCFSDEEITIGETEDEVDSNMKILPNIFKGILDAAGRLFPKLPFSGRLASSPRSLIIPIVRYLRG